MSTTVIEKLGGRKFIVIMYTLIVLSVLMYIKGIDDQTFKTMVMGIVLLYIGGNVGQKAITKPILKTPDSSLTNTPNAVMTALNTIENTAGSTNGASS